MNWFKKSQATMPMPPVAPLKIAPKPSNEPKWDQVYVQSWRNQISNLKDRLERTTAAINAEKRKATTPGYSNNRLRQLEQHYVAVKQKLDYSVEVLNQVEGRSGTKQSVDKFKWWEHAGPAGNPFTQLLNIDKAKQEHKKRQPSPSFDQPQFKKPFGAKPNTGNDPYGGPPF